MHFRDFQMKNIRTFFSLIFIYSLTFHIDMHRITFDSCQSFSHSGYSTLHSIIIILIRFLFSFFFPHFHSIAFRLSSFDQYSSSITFFLAKNFFLWRFLFSLPLFFFTPFSYFVSYHDNDDDYSLFWFSIHYLFSFCYIIKNITWREEKKKKGKEKH